MIDYQKVETFRALSGKKGKTELIKYATTLGVTAAKDLEFDDIVKLIETAVTPANDIKEEIEELVSENTESTFPTEEEVIVPIPEVVVPKELPTMAFGIMGDSFPWAWNMSNINNKYWYSGVDSAQHAELLSDLDSDFKSFVFKLMKSSGMSVVVREPRNSQFVHITSEGITTSNVIYL